MDGAGYRQCKLHPRALDASAFLRSDCAKQFARNLYCSIAARTMVERNGCYSAIVGYQVQREFPRGSLSAACCRSQSSPVRNQANDPRSKWLEDGESKCAHYCATIVVDEEMGRESHTGSEPSLILRKENLWMNTIMKSKTLPALH